MLQINDKLYYDGEYIGYLTKIDYPQMGLNNIIVKLVKPIIFKSSGHGATELYNDIIFRTKEGLIIKFINLFIIYTEPQTFYSEYSGQDVFIEPKLKGIKGLVEIGKDKYYNYLHIAKMIKHTKLINKFCNRINILSKEVI